MALAWYVDGRGRDGKSIAAAFAARDEYVSTFTFFHRRLSGEEAVWKERPLTPEEDYYPAPYCFLPKKDRTGQPSGGGFLVFTMQVPWLHGSRTDEHLSKENRAHHCAKDHQDRRGEYDSPHIGTVESFQGALGLDEREVFAFTPDGRYPTREDISQALEDRAVEVTCAEMNWEIPTDWRRERRKGQTKLPPVFDLAEWDLRKAKSKGPNGETKSSTQAKPKGDGDQDGEEEKKDSVEEYQC